MKSLPKLNLIINHLVLIATFVFLIFGLSNGAKTLDFYFNGYRVEATVDFIVDTDEENFIRYSYIVEGKLYKGTFNNSKDYSKGDKINVYVKNNDPSESIVYSWNLVISIGLVVVFLPVFIYYLILLYKYYSFVYNANKALERNVFRECTIMDVNQIFKKELSGIVPLIVTCIDENNNEYKSNLIYCSIQNPLSIINYKIKVYQYKDFYYVDIDSIKHN